MTTFLALYRGRTVNQSQLIATSADADLVALVAARLLGESRSPSPDSILNAIQRGRSDALQQIVGSPAISFNERTESSQNETGVAR